MNARVEIGSRRAAEWLKADAEWSIDTAAVCYETLVTDCVAESFSRALREGDRAIEEVCFAHVVRIVDTGNECRKGNRFDDARCRKSADGLRVVVQLQSRVGGVCVL